MADDVAKVEHILRTCPIRSGYVIDPLAYSVREVAEKIVVALRPTPEKADPEAPAMRFTTTQQPDGLWLSVCDDRPEAQAYGTTAQQAYEGARWAVEILGEPESLDDPALGRS